MKIGKLRLAALLTLDDGSDVYLKLDDGLVLVECAEIDDDGLVLVECAEIDDDGDLVLIPLRPLSKS